jgi:hypothetical protein
MEDSMKRIILIVTTGYIIVALYASTFGAPPQILTPQGDSTNRPAVYPNTAQPTPMNSTNRVSQTGGNPNLPPAYQGGPSNLHDTIGTNEPNRGYNQTPQPTVTNHPNPTLPMQ